LVSSGLEAAEKGSKEGRKEGIMVAAQRNGALTSSDEKLSSLLQQNTRRKKEVT
jgi:hypothetical protein